MHDDLLAELAIRLARSTPGNHKTMCPQCSHTRRHKRDACLSIKIDDQGIVWNCHNCAWSGGAGDLVRSDSHRRVRKARPWNW